MGNSNLVCQLKWNQITIRGTAREIMCFPPSSSSSASSRECSLWCINTYSSPNPIKQKLGFFHFFFFFYVYLWAVPPNISTHTCVYVCLNGWWWVLNVSYLYKKKIPHTYIICYILMLFVCWNEIKNNIHLFCCFIFEVKAFFFF